MSPADRNPMPDWPAAAWEALCDPDAPLILFPVRHHSPLCARLVVELIRSRRPACVLVEGPADFNPQIDSLGLGHDLPIAIYSWYEHLGVRAGAFYPFCEHSPEWQAVRVAQDAGVPVRFIDQPWAEQQGRDATWNRYADGDLRRTPYIETLLARRHMSNFDELWDDLFEAHRDLTPATFMARMHTFCAHMRLSSPASPGDRDRERVMAEHIRAAQAEFGGPILVVTGGFHSAALHARVTALPWSEPLGGDDVTDSSTVTDPERGLTLTPYTDEQLDGLRGYESGMPNPGFYGRIWHDEERSASARDSWREMLALVAKDLRKRQQTVSTADLIAVEGMTRALADMRGHRVPWRGDLIDGTIAALVKDEFSLDEPHPFLNAVNAVLRGDRVGKLAEGTQMPPLAIEILAALEAEELMPVRGKPREVTLDLMLPADRRKSRLLHRLATIEISGFRQTERPDRRREEMLSETWELSWSVMLTADCIVSCRYGIDLHSAAHAYLTEQAGADNLTARGVADILMRAAFCGLTERLGDLRERLLQMLRSETTFMVLLAALGRLVYLMRHAHIYEAHDLAELREFVAAAWEQSIIVLENGLPAADDMPDWLAGVSLIVRLCLEWGDDDALDRETLVLTMKRLEVMAEMTPEPRGAATGARWCLDAATIDDLTANMRRFADPAMLGPYLSGLFHVARLTVSRHEEILAGIHRELQGWDRATFLRALPGLRLAFSVFTPRERLQIADRVAGVAGIAAPLPVWRVSPDDIAEAMRVEAEAATLAARLGLRLAGALNVASQEAAL